MGASLTQEQLDRYDDQGILFPLPVMSAEEATGYLAHANAIETALGGNCKPVELSQMHLHYQWAYDLITHPRILDAVESILGENLVADIALKGPPRAEVGYRVFFSVRCQSAPRTG